MYAGGRFIYAGGRLAIGVARWNGGEWSEVGGGTNHHIDALASYKGELIAGGKFTAAGGLKAGGLARWDGAKWSQLGPTGAPVRALSVIGDHVYAGGLFTQIGAGPGKVVASRIARYDGSKWSPLGDGVNGPVNAIGSYKGDIIAGGGFTHAGGTKAGGLAAWNGSSWKGLGFFGAPIKAVAEYKNELYVGGHFKQVSGLTAYRIARWNGSSWNTVGPTSVAQGAVSALRVVDLGDGPVLAVGSAGSVLPGDSARVALWDGAGWMAVDTAPNSASHGVLAIAMGDADGSGPNPVAMYVGGHFNAIGKDSRGFLAEYVACEGRPGSPSQFATCDADCDGSGVLDAADLACFHGLFVGRSPEADCNGDGEFSVDDYVFFQSMLAAGC